MSRSCCSKVSIRVSSRAGRRPKHRLGHRFFVERALLPALHAALTKARGRGRPRHTSFGMAKAVRRRFGYPKSGVARFRSRRCLAPGDEPDALETRPRITKASKFITRRVENLTWQTCNS